ncbi:MAG TPA: ATP-binding cassette domain-containing protein [Ktedonobacteraceae bacterium]|jgi:ABC-2 type transport system ATP-binding protein|nr:ATP-binding cassette domain-containing protein [Ktedonobacteraceae bacterium]
MVEFGSHTQRYITGPIGQQARPCVVSFEHISTKRDGELALYDISLDIYEGESIAVIGSPGAGKSELMACVQGLVPSSEGHLHVLGYEVPPLPAEVRRQMGVMPGQLERAETLLVADLIRRFAGYYKLDLSESQVEVYCRHFALSSSWPVAHLTPTQVRLLALSLALVHDPHLVLLDEPFAGLSGAGSLLIGQYLRGIQSEGRTLLITCTTPIAEELLTGYDCIIMLEKGHIQSVKQRKR